jgi:cytochrome c oxidase subunit 2
MNHTTFHFLPPQASSSAGRIDFVAAFILCVCLFFTLVIAALVIYFAIRYRRGAIGPKAIMHDPGHSRGALIIEIVWSVIPLILVSIMFFMGASIYLRVFQPPEDALEIHVVGKQWMWHIQQPNGLREINKLHIPANKDVKLIMTSQDVIHDFFIPAFRQHQDVVPGRYTTEWFRATRVGEYPFFCAQYCGAQHAEMIGTVTVMEPAQYEAWLAGTNTGESPRDNGEKLFTLWSCVQCHSSRGPTMAGLYGRPVDLENGASVLANEEYLHDKILDPFSRGVVKGFPRIMPAYRSTLSEEQVMDLIAYIKSLSGATTMPYSGPTAGPATQPNKAVPGPMPFLPTTPN